jgi:methionyl aminopeptidase
VLSDNLIEKKGGFPAFPLNVDINHIAAHYTSPLGDDSIIPDGSIVKLDLGVHMDGYIADTATTVCFKPEMRFLSDAAESALNAAINTIKAGVSINEVGAAIENNMKLNGVKPIRNLTGHKMNRYNLHAGKCIPNIANWERQRLEEGEVYAVEPFTVLPHASGLVENGSPSNIYRFAKKRSIGFEAKELLKYIQTEYRTLPFSSRWILRKFPNQNTALVELIDSKCILSYPQLIEKSRSLVAQSEHTIIVTKDGCLVTTV